jgi:hypothetical protein
VVSQDWSIEIARTKLVVTPIFENCHNSSCITWCVFLSFIYGVICHTFALIWLFQFFPPQSRRNFLYDSQNTHKNGKKFILKLRSLSNTKVRNLEFKRMEFVSVTNKSIQIKKTLLLKVGSFIFLNEVKTTKSTKTTF